MIKSKTYAKFLDKEENKTKCRSKQSAGDTLQRVRHNTDEQIDSSIVDDHDLWLALLLPDENCGDLSIGTIETTLLQITGCQLFINYLNNILIDMKYRYLSHTFAVIFGRVVRAVNCAVVFDRIITKVWTRHHSITICT